ncbi:hypothetical protein O988_08742 [Pseudogymnoascus sp. VKM F-3808]|nr:hypothetical protein O988_08742 [Pseudogymnoascus sp. VKM F-3808]
MFWATFPLAPNHGSAAGIECSGFESTLRLRFVDEGPRIKRSIAVSLKKAQDISTVAPSVSCSGQIRQTQCLWHAPFLGNKMFEKQCYQLDTTAEIRCGLPADWIPELIATPQKQRSKSWDALAAIVFGQTHKNFDAIAHAYRLYGQALTELRSELSYPTGSTLMSMTALYKYEMLVSTTEQGWTSHAEGLGWLLEQRGPWQQKSYAETSIFLEHRLTLVAKSIISRQGTFLCNQIWKTVPWEDNPTGKLAIDYLVDIGADIAEYIAYIEKYDDSWKSGYSDIRSQVATSLNELNLWWSHWEAENAHSATEIPLYPTTTPAIFTTLLRYNRIDTAFTVCIYDAMRILLLQLWQMLERHRNPLEATYHRGIILDLPNQTALLGITSSIKGLASEILRSLEFCYGEFPRFIYSVSFLFIQDVAYGCFDKGSEEAIWIAEHGWAERAKGDHIEEANLLKRLLPFGQIRGSRTAHQ